MTGTPSRTLDGMTAPSIIPLPEAGQWTWDDLQAVPDQAHHHYELIEGQILMSPSPTLTHQRCVMRLALRLAAAVPADLEVLPAPFDFVPEPGTSLQPDLLVVRRGTTEPNRTVAPPVLAVEVLSPSTRTTDTVTKRALYERFGVPHYWIVDPDELSIVALRLAADGRYRDAEPVGDFSAVEPFPVSFPVAALVRD